MSDEPISTILINFFKNEKGIEEIELLEEENHSRYSQLNNDMNIIADYSIDDQITGTVGRRNEFWGVDKNAPIEITEIGFSEFKLFDGDNKWIGTLRERLLDEIVQSYKSDPRIVFAISLKDEDCTFNITQRPNFYIFPFIVEEKSKYIEYFILEKKLISLGSDWVVKRSILNELKVAFIDQKWGNKIKISIYDEALAKNTSFINYLILFSGTIPYHDEIKERIKQYSKSIKEASLMLKVCDKILNDYADKPIYTPSRYTKPKQEEKPKSKEKRAEEKPADKKSGADIKGKLKEDIEKSSKEQKKKKLAEEEKTKQKPKGKELAFKIEDPIEDSPGIGKKTGQRFREIGIETIGDFINADIEEIHEKLPVTWITKSKLRKWKKICVDHII
jgi:predicted flap endonuclease-1-like 5' DNA nuclease